MLTTSNHSEEDTMTDQPTDLLEPEASVQIGGGRLLKRDLYAMVFVLILATIIASAALGDGAWGLIATLVLQATTLWIALRASDIGTKAQLFTVAVAGLVIVSVAAAILTHNLQPARIASTATMVLLVGITPVVIVRELVKRPVINLTTVMGAADIYLLFGLFFAMVYNLMGAIASHGASSALEAFFYSSRPLTQSDFIYYSYVTLTTVGFGDVTAASSLGRMLSVTEALIGQLYLVTVVALLVGNFGRSRVARQPHGSVSRSATSADES
jgi:hypothetical protein